MKTNTGNRKSGGWFRYFTLGIPTGSVLIALVLMLAAQPASGMELGVWTGSGKDISPIPAGEEYVSLAACSDPHKPGSFYALTAEGETFWVYSDAAGWHSVLLVAGQFKKITSTEDGTGTFFALSGDGIYHIGWLGEWSASKLVDGKYRAISSNYLDGQTAFCYAVSESGEIVLIGWDSAKSSWTETRLVSGDYVDIVQLPSAEHPIYALRGDGGVDRVVRGASDGLWKAQPVLEGKYKSLLCPGVNATRSESLLVLNDRGEAELATFDGDTCKTSPAKLTNLQAAVVKRGDPAGYFVIAAP